MLSFGNNQRNMPLLCSSIHPLCLPLLRLSACSLVRSCTCPPVRPYTSLSIWPSAGPHLRSHRCPRPPLCSSAHEPLRSSACLLIRTSAPWLVRWRARQLIRSSSYTHLLTRSSGHPHLGSSARLSAYSSARLLLRSTLPKNITKYQSQT